MRIHFEEDMKKALNEGFAGFGIRPTSRIKIEDALLDFLTTVKKLVQPRRRTVRYNPAFKARITNHPKCSEILYLEKLFNTGQNVNFFQSKKLFQTGFHDHLVYEWGIYHFHLSLEKERKSNFMKQTRQLLFVFVLDEEAIFLDTDSHDVGSFGDPKWIQILHDHFPETIVQHLETTITDLSPNVNPSERQTLWDKGYLIGMTPVIGAIYRNPGIGRTSSGHSVLVVKMMGEIMRWLWEMVDVFEKSYEEICSVVQLDPMYTDFVLRIGEHTFEIIDSRSRKIIITYPERLN